MNNCKNCKFYKMEEFYRVTNMGVCRYNPPREFKNTTRFPTVKETEWCGKHTLVCTPKD